MKNSKTLSQAALCGLLAGLTSQIGHAAPTDKVENWEKCAGIAKEGKNDCAAGKHTCHARSGAEWAGKAEWIYVPANTCEKISGGKVLEKVPARKS